MPRRTSAVLLLVACILAGLSAYFALRGPKGKATLKIFHAGSLALMLDEAEETYESLRPDIDIQREPSGSVKAVRKISDLGKRCDVVMVADYKVIDKYLVPDYADWSIVFCSNEIVLCYTDKSMYADEISEENWYEILMRPGVRYGFSNPNLDPCGYRALSIMYMSSLYYGEDYIWSELVLEYIRNVNVATNESGHYVFFPASPDYVAGGKLVLRDKSVDLVELLEAGTLDYAFEYRNVAEEHGLKYVRLPRELNLREDPFVRAFVVLYAGDPERQKTVAIAKIRYGLTIPKNCENCGEALEFLKWLLYGDGREIIERHGFVSIPYEFEGEVPLELRG